MIPHVRPVLPWLFLFAVFSCSPRKDNGEGSRTEVLHAFLTQHGLGAGPHDIRAVVAVSEEGCMSCNKRFASWTSHHLTDERVVFVVSAVGAEVDLSPFQEQPARVIWDPERTFQRSGLIAGSGFILLGATAIDTTVELDVAQLDAQFGMLARHLE